MPAFFRKNNNEPSVDEKTRQRLEEYFLWLINSFGKEYIKNKKVLNPDNNDFPVFYNEQLKSASDTLKIVATQMDLDPGEIKLHIYKEGQIEIDTGSPFGQRIFLQNVKGEKYSGGLYFGKLEDGKYLIGLEEKKLKDPLGMIATIAHELSHIKLLGEKRIETNNELLTDLTTIVFGLGVLSANSAFRTLSGFDFWGWNRSGYLSQRQWGYALALYAYLREEENPEWIKFLSPNVKGAFNQSITFIRNNPELIYTVKDTTVEPKVENVVANKMRDARKNKNFDELINLSKKQLSANPKDKILNNNIGYYLLQQKKYEEAIGYFNQAIKIAPKYDFPYNNRGYCKLQLDDVTGAYEDIKKACEMNPFNSFAWRNLGAYYLKINELEKALENFEEAENVDNKTELLNFYLGKTHEKLGNFEKAKEFLYKSIELNEHNDSLIE
ncbi:tetratricopeptide repeat protein [Chitinophagaceae bacterium 26-R-25]|nr:tetratricopeptide repeat protein [Chitinophagaceae bacterium 26-R-25]